MDAIERVAGRVLARARDVRRRVVRAAVERIAARELARGRRERRQINGRGENGEGRRRIRQAAVNRENAERVAARDRDRSEVKAPAAAAQGTHAPAPARARFERVEDAAHAVRRQFRGIHQLDPDFGKPAGVVGEEAFLRHAPDLRARRDHLAFESKGENAVRGPKKREGQDGEDEIGEPKENRVPGLIAEAGQQQPRDHERPLPHRDADRAGARGNPKFAFTERTEKLHGTLYRISPSPSFDLSSGAGGSAARGFRG